MEEASRREYQRDWVYAGRRPLSSNLEKWSKANHVRRGKSGHSRLTGTEPDQNRTTT